MSSALPRASSPDRGPTPAAATPLRILFVEDDPLDVQLEVGALTAAGLACEWERVDTAEAFVARLDAGPECDLVIADYRLPHFGGLDALRLLRTRHADLPFVLVSGTLGEEAAIEMLRLGATDYVLKQHLERLAPVVQRVLKAAEEHRQHARAEGALRDSEARYRSLVDGAPDVILTVGPDDRFTSLNPAFESVLGFRCAEWIGRPFTALPAAADVPLATAMLARVRAGESMRGVALRIPGAAGGEHTVELTLTAPPGVTDGSILGIARDITARARVEARTRALVDIARELSGSRNLVATLREVCARIASVMPCAMVVIVGDASAGGDAHVLAHHGIAERDPSRRRLAPHGAVDAALRAGRTLVFERAADLELIRELTDTGVTHAVAAPVHWHGRHFGGLVFADRSGARFDADQIAFAEAIAPQIGATLDADDLRRAEREEGEVATALARIGQELISSVDLPVLLDLLCRITTDVLQCDVAYTLLYREEEDEYVPVASFGYAPERWESMRALRVPRALVPGLSDPLHSDGIVHASEAIQGRDAPRELLAAYDVREMLAVALRRGTQVVGVHVAAQRTAGSTFGPRQYRIAGGLAQLASLALENARLVDELEGANRLKSDLPRHHVARAAHAAERHHRLHGAAARRGLRAPQSGADGQPRPRRHAAPASCSSSSAPRSTSAGWRPAAARSRSRSSTPRRCCGEIEVETAAVRDKPGVESVWTIADDLPPLYSDAVKLKVLLKNLIDNAFKFTDAGSVAVSATADGGWLELCVADTGIGMSPEAQAVIFEPFRQGDSSTTRRHGGVGLGLYIVSRLLDMLGGRIEVESAPEQGSTFRVSIPLDALRPVTPDAGPGRPGHSASGRLNQNVEPRPGALSTPIEPPICSISRRQMARPRPLPPCERVAAAACENGWNKRAISSGAMPNPVSLISQRRRVPGIARSGVTCTPMLPRSVNFTALPTRLPTTCARRSGSRDQGLGQRAVHGGVQAHVLGRRVARVRRERLIEPRPQRERTRPQIDDPGVHLGEVEQVIDERVELSGRALDRLDEVALLRRHRDVERHVGHAEDDVDRRPQVVAHAGDEVAPRAAGRFRRLLRRLQLLAREEEAAPLPIAEHRPGDRQAAERQHAADEDAARRPTAWTVVARPITSPAHPASATSNCGRPPSGKAVRKPITR